MDRSSPGSSALCSTLPLSITSTSAPHNPPPPRQLWHFLLIDGGPGLPSVLPGAILAACGHRSLGAWPGACTFDLEQCSQIDKISPRAGVRFWSSRPSTPGVQAPSCSHGPKGPLGHSVLHLLAGLAQHRGQKGRWGRRWGCLLSCRTLTSWPRCVRLGQPRKPLLHDAVPDPVLSFLCCENTGREHLFPCSQQGNAGSPGEL